MGLPCSLYTILDLPDFLPFSSWVLFVTNVVWKLYVLI